MRKKDTSMVGVTLKHSDRAQLQAIADAQHRALSNLVAAIALDYLAAHKRKSVPHKHVNGGNGHDKASVGKSVTA